MAKEVIAASEASGEKLWRLPLEESYWESMKSGVADMVNTGGRPGGAITAALFLKQVYDLHYFFFLLDMSCSVTCFDCNPCFSGSLSSLSEFLPLFNICSVFIFNFYKPWRKGREGEERGGVLGDWGSRVSCCSYFDSLLSKVLFNCSCYGFLKL